MSDGHWPVPQEYQVPPPGADSVPVLEAISLDRTRPEIERVAALVMLGSATRDNRRDEILEHFGSIFSGIARYHVHVAEWFVAGLAGGPDRIWPSVGSTLPARSQPIQLEIRPTDLPILGEMALTKELTKNGDYPGRVYRAMAAIAVGLTDDPRALGVLLSCPPLWIGDAGQMRDAVLHGLNLLCRNPSRRDELAAWLDGHKEASAHRYRAILALAYHTDERAIPPLCDLVRQLHERETSLRATSQPAETMTPVARYLQAETPYILGLCTRFGGPRTAEAVLDYVYAGGRETQSAMLVVRDSGVTPDKTRLLAVLEKPLKYWEAQPIQDVLTQILEPEEMDKVIRLLGRAGWGQEDFFARVLWIKRLPDRLLVPSLKNRLEELAREHPNGAVRTWAQEALSRFKDRPSSRPEAAP